MVLFTVMALALLALREFFQWMEKLNLRPYRGLTYASGFILVLLFYGEYLRGFVFQSELPSFLPFIFLLLIGYLLGFTVIYIFSADTQNFLRKIAIQFFALFYGVICVSHVLLFLKLPSGIGNLLFFLLIPILTDSLAYFSGRRWGRHLARIRLSPGKTLEGFGGGVLLTVLLVFLVQIGLEAGLREWLQGFFLADSQSLQSQNAPLFFWPESWLELIALTTVLSVIVIIADLFESGLKRSLQIKDSSTLLPGHGGFFDLMDSFLWSIPLGYYYLWIKVAWWN